MKPHSRRLSSTFLLFISAVFFCLFVSEGLFRFYVFCAKPLYRPSSIEGLGWEFTPGAVKKAAGTLGKTITYRINDHGFRDQSEGSWQPWQNGDVKIAILGDSVTAGAQMDYAETYSAQLEELLRREGLRARVVNFGVDATNTRQQFALMQSRLLALKPDILLLAYFMNDIERSGLERLPKPARELLRRWHLGAFLSQRLVQTFRNRKETSRYRYDLHPGAADTKTCSGYMLETLQAYQTEKWREPSLWIQRIQELAARNGIDFEVLIFPFEPQIRGICPLRVQSEITSFLKQAGIPFLDIAESFQKIPSAGFYIPGDPVHLSAAGHRAAAETVRDWLKDQGILQLKRG